MAHRRITEAVNEEMSARRVTRVANEKKILIGIRIGERQKKLLHEHFAEKGLELGTGIRSVLYEYIKKK